MSEAILLEAAKREAVGKKVKQLRAQGIIPAVVYGPKQTPQKIQVPWTVVRPVLLEAGGTNLIELNVGGQKYTTLVRDVHRHPVNKDRVLHIDFYAVDLTEKLVTSVPIVLQNDAETEIRIDGRVLLEMTAIDVESLPDKIPSEIVLDVSSIQEIGDSLTVADLPQLEGVEYMPEETTTVVRTERHGVMPEEEEAEEEEVLETDMSAEPEVISRRKEDEFEEE